MRFSFTQFFALFVAATSFAGASKVDSSANPQHKQLSARAVVAGTVCANVAVVLAGLTIIPEICLCTKAGVLTDQSLADLTAQLTIAKAKNPLLPAVNVILSTVVGLLTGQVAGTPATCDYPANSVPLCSNGSPSGCAFTCATNFKACNGGCIPSANTCSTGGFNRRDQSFNKACPNNWVACPVQVGRKTIFECINVNTDLESCGGCPGVEGQGTDCTALDGVNDVHCIAGRCLAQSCLRGFVLNGTTCIASSSRALPRRIALL